VQKCVVSKHWAKGSAGAEELAEAVINIVDNREPGFRYVYDENLGLWEKIEPCHKTVRCSRHLRQRQS